jgi:glycine cleavage system H protein
MSGELSFMMGQFEAKFPDDRLYAKNHMWAQERPSGCWRFGFTAYAVRLLQDVYFLDWVVEADAAVREKQQIGSIESKKAESDLFAPLSGTLTALNSAVLKDPACINVDKYGTGWLFEMQAASPAVSALLTATDYLRHLESVWEVTQRTIKGQMNDA